MSGHLALRLHQAERATQVQYIVSLYPRSEREQVYIFVYMRPRGKSFDKVSLWLFDMGLGQLQTPELENFGNAT